MIAPQPERGITHTHARALNGAMLVIAASSLALFASGRTTGDFRDSEPLTYSQRACQTLEAPTSKPLRRLDATTGRVL